MDKEVADKIADLTERISFQERAHSHITKTETGGVNSSGGNHGTVSNLPAIIVAVLFSGVVAFLTARYYIEKNK